MAGLKQDGGVLWSWVCRLSDERFSRHRRNPVKRSRLSVTSHCLQSNGDVSVSPRTWFISQTPQASALIELFLQLTGKILPCFIDLMRLFQNVWVILSTCPLIIQSRSPGTEHVLLLWQRILMCSWKFTEFPSYFLFSGLLFVFTVVENREPDRSRALIQASLYLCSSWRWCGTGQYEGTGVLVWMSLCCWFYVSPEVCLSWRAAQRFLREKEKKKRFSHDTHHVVTVIITRQQQIKPETTW